MVDKIISNPNGFRELILAAQGLVNEKFNTNKAQLLGMAVKKSQSNNLKKFKKAIKESSLLTAKEKEKIKEDNDLYKLAREIILQFTAKEIKSPLAK